jgi:hypothetical protein
MSSDVLRPQKNCAGEARQQFGSTNNPLNVNVALSLETSETVPDQK